MKMLLLILLIPVSFGSTSIDKEAKDLVERWKVPRSQCEEHVFAILKKAYFIDESTPSGQVAERFVKDEQQALKIMRSLDYKKITFGESMDYSRFLYKNCSSDSNSVEIPVSGCDYNFELYTFFKALVYSVKHYQWSNRTKDEANKHIQKYLRVIAETQTEMIDKMLAIDVLKLSSNFSLVSEKNQELIKELEVESEKINSQFKKLNSRDIKQWDLGKRVCGSAYAILEDEIAEAQRVGARLLEVLGKVTYK